MQQNKLNFNLPWNQHEDYTICVTLPALENFTLIQGELGGEIVHGNIFALPCGNKWRDNWQEVQRVINKYDLEDIRISVIHGTVTPEKVTEAARGPAELQEIADSLWLGDALLEGRVECYFQEIVDTNNNIVGYESFARAILENGNLAEGNKIMDASFFLGIQYGIDKYLHTLAIETFAKYKMQGNLFVNFMTGFIQIPAKYLEGLSVSLKESGLEPSRLVLDVSKSDHITNIEQVASVVDFCASQGYQVALDDVKQVETLEAILAKAMPNYIKIDRTLIHHLGRPIILEKIKTIIAISHSRGCKILAEGIEDEKSHKTLLDLGADMFQGYYFAKPLPASGLRKPQVQKAS